MKLRLEPTNERPSQTARLRYHVAYTLANWDTDKSGRSADEAESKRRKLEIRATEGGFHVKDPDGFEVQMGGKRQ